MLCCYITILSNNNNKMDSFVFNTTEDLLSLVDFLIVSLINVVQITCDKINEINKDLTPAQVLIKYSKYGLLAYFLFQYSRHIIPLWTRQGLLRRLRKLPVIKSYVNKKLDGLARDIKKDLCSIYQNEDFVKKLPSKSTSADLVIKKVKHYQMFDTANWQQGRISGAIYTNNSSRYNEVLLSVFGSNMWSNPLHSDVFAGVRKMEAEIVRMVISMYNGDPEIMLGSVTSGGTESIFLACKAYRDFKLETTPMPPHERPEIVAPVTAHAAFEKAAKLLNCKIKHIPVDRKTCKVDIKAMERAINHRTCMLVGSAPQFPHGIIDPISEIARLGIKRKVPVHVDACLGGFLLPFMRDAGHELDERFDFSVDGVTSISADTHKYGYAPKGTSVVVYSDKKYLHHQYCVSTDWPGGIYASPTLPGSRPGALIATCWAAMMYHGREGYVLATDKIIKTTKWIRKELSQVEGLEVMGDPQVSVLAFRSDKFDIYAMNGKLKELGWNLNALQFPSAFHLCVTLMHTNNGVSASFVRDVKSIAKQLLLEPASKASGSAAIYGMAQTVPDRSLVGEICTRYLDGCLGQ